ncbi:MAG: hypothetical protein QG590_1323 [Pseudomonadota bacterium]|nr:hypothetical protein [Pseudomonadota bacterium]
MRLALLIPELIWPEPGDAAALGNLPCPALGALLARGRLMRDNSGDATFDAGIAACFGLESSAPYAALRLLGEELVGVTPGEHHWTCADPVHLRFHQERLILADGATIDIQSDEAVQLVGALNQYFSDIGEFHAATPDRWYLRLSTEADFRTPPLSAMAGRRIDRQLPEETRTAWLRKLLNEAQMVLHGHAANEARTDSGRMAINSLWLWGPGQLPKQLSAEFDGVWSNHPLARGLARCAGIACHDTPVSYAALSASADSWPLVVIDDLLNDVHYEDGEAWRRHLQKLEADWFVPMAQAVRSGKLSLELRASTIYGQLSWQVGARDLWKLWQRPQPLATLANQLMERA